MFVMVVIEKNQTKDIVKVQEIFFFFDKTLTNNHSGNKTEQTERTEN